jgi:hypothetical protein
MNEEMEQQRQKYRDFNSAMAKSKPHDRFIGYKESFFNTVSKIVGCNAKQCCYACAGLSEKPLYTNDKTHAYLYVAICEGHVRCLDKIVGYVTKKIDKINDQVSVKEDIKRRYLQKLYMSLIEINNDFEKRQRMIQLLRKYGFFVEDDEDTYGL